MAIQKLWDVDILNDSHGDHYSKSLECSLALYPWSVGITQIRHDLMIWMVIPRTSTSSPFSLLGLFTSEGDKEPGTFVNDRQIPW